MLTPPCPTCAGPLNPEDDETVWLLHGKFYCSEKCCKIAMGSERG